MNNSRASENLIANITEAINTQNIVMAAELIESAQHLYPIDMDIKFLSAMLKIVNNNKAEAISELWHTLSLAPRAQLLRNSIFELFVQNLTDRNDINKDFSLHSGERQVGTSISQIRLDHRVRYEFVAQFLCHNFENPWKLTGLDAFSGNGYGSRIVSDMSGAKMIGVDGSFEAVRLAENTYGSHRCIFGDAVFPFKIYPGKRSVLADAF